MKFLNSPPPAWLWLIPMGLCLFGLALAAYSQDHQAFGAHQEIVVTVTAEVPDIAKLEAKAVDILRKWDPALTLTAARAKVRVDGKTDVARCMEYVVINALGSITQAKVSGIRQEVQHPEPAAALIESRTYWRQVGEQADAQGRLSIIDALAGISAQ